MDIGTLEPYEVEALIILDAALSGAEVKEEEEKESTEVKRGWPKRKGADEHS